ncbi:SURF1 family protein [Zobellella sp. DQSA1]|uniref:SURF1 family protein n=1 Tax=Zobellella sp. DQSA1 TaxID=3342386 RepID=UPI0035BF0E8F
MSIGKSWGLLALTLLMTTLMVTMGIWQLSRADDKRQLLQEWQQRRDIVLDLDEALAIGSPFGYRLDVGGVYLAGGDLFLDSQIQDGRVGYRLIRPLQTPYGLLAVDTGWWPADADRRRLPVVTLPEGTVQLSGVLIRPYRPPLSLGGAPDPQARRINGLDPGLLQSRWGQRALPFVLRLEEGAEWQPVVMGPERHLGYAVQWFAMALAVWVAALVFYRRRHEA